MSTSSLNIPAYLPQTLSYAVIKNPNSRSATIALSATITLLAVSIIVSVGYLVYSVYLYFFQSDLENSPEPQEIQPAPQQAENDPENIENEDDSVSVEYPAEPQEIQEDLNPLQVERDPLLPEVRVNGFILSVNLVPFQRLVIDLREVDARVLQILHQHLPSVINGHIANFPIPLTIFPRIQQAEARPSLEEKDPFLLLSEENLPSPALANVWNQMDEIDAHWKKLENDSRLSPQFIATLYEIISINSDIPSILFDEFLREYSSFELDDNKINQIFGLLNKHLNIAEVTVVEDSSSSSSFEEDYKENECSSIERHRPKNERKPIIFIPVILKPSNRFIGWNGIGHIVLIVLDSESKTIEYYDSKGTSYLNQEATIRNCEAGSVKKLIKGLSEKMSDFEVLENKTSWFQIFSNKQHQSVFDTINCGLFVSHYISERLLGKSFKDIMNSAPPFPRDRREEFASFFEIAYKEISLEKEKIKRFEEFSKKLKDLEVINIKPTNEPYISLPKNMNREELTQDIIIRAIKDAIQADINRNFSIEISDEVFDKKNPDANPVIEEIKKAWKGKFNKEIDDRNLNIIASSLYQSVASFSWIALSEKFSTGPNKYFVNAEGIVPLKLEIMDGEQAKVHISIKYSYIEVLEESREKIPVANIKVEGWINLMTVEQQYQCCIVDHKYLSQTQ